MAIEYGDNTQMLFHSGTMSVHHQIVVDATPVTCRVSTEYLQDILGMRDGDALDFAKEHFDQLTDAWGDMASRGIFEEDGTILLRSS